MHIKSEEKKNETKMNSRVFIWPLRLPIAAPFSALPVGEMPI